MEKLDFSQFELESAEYDQCVSNSPDLDAFCSSSAWILSAVEAFQHVRFNPYIWRAEEGYIALCQGHHPRIGTFRQPLEASWCLASPFASPTPHVLVQHLMDHMRQEPRTSWDMMFLSGLIEGSEAYRSVVSLFGGKYFVGVGPSIGRYVASLDGGLDAFLNRRTSKFRANLRRIERKAVEQGVTFERFVGSPESTNWQALYQRILAIEDLSWKGMEGTGISDASMKTFYAKMLPRLGVQGQLRVIFIRKDDRDIAYIFGGVLKDTYRGLQMSFDNNFRSLSLGNLAQFRMVRWLCEQGVGFYDLGSELDYKAKWAERRVETISLIVRQW